MRRVLVTAALGNVGREVARACADAFVVRVAGLRESALAERFPGLETARLDFLDRSTWGVALADCELLFLLRPPPIGNMQATLIPFVDAARAAGVQHVVFSSVAGADRIRWAPHRKVELHLENTFDAWTVLRPGFFAQNLEDAYRRDIVEDGRLYVPAGGGRVAFLDVRDGAEVAAHVFGNPAAFQRETMTLTGPRAVTFEEVAHTLSSVLKRTIVYTPASVPGYAWHLRMRRELPWMQIAVQSVLHLGLRRGDAENVDPTIEKLPGRPARALRDYIERASPAWRG